MSTADDVISWWTHALTEPLRRKIIQDPGGELPAKWVPQPGSIAGKNGHLQIETTPEGKFMLEPPQVEQIRTLTVKLDAWWEQLDSKQKEFWVTHQSSAFERSTAAERSEPPFGLVPAVVAGDLEPHTKASLFLSDYIAVHSTVS